MLDISGEIINDITIDVVTNTTKSVDKEKI